MPQEGEAIISTSTLFYPCSSWLNRLNVKGSIIHEQLHFDIAEYYKRLFLKMVSETKTSWDLFPVSTRAIFRDITEQKRIMNADYDRLTNFGTIYQEQNKWNQKIASLLEDLKKFSGTSASVTVK